LELDVALIQEPEQLPTGFLWEEIARQEVVAAAPKDAEETEIKGLLAHYPYIRFNRTARVAPLIKRRLAKLGLTPLPVVELHPIEAIRSLVRLGFGVSILPSTGPKHDAEGLCHISIGEPPLYRRIGFFKRADMSRRRVAGIVQEAFKAAAA